MLHLRTAHPYLSVADQNIYPWLYMCLGGSREVLSEAMLHAAPMSDADALNGTGSLLPSPAKQRSSPTPPPTPPSTSCPSFARGAEDSMTAVRWRKRKTPSPLETNELDTTLTTTAIAGCTDAHSATDAEEGRKRMCIGIYNPPGKVQGCSKTVDPAVPTGTILTARAERQIKNLYLGPTSASTTTTAPLDNSTMPPSGNVHGHSALVSSAKTEALHDVSNASMEDAMTENNTEQRQSCFDAGNRTSDDPRVHDGTVFVVPEAPVSTACHARLVGAETKESSKVSKRVNSGLLPQSRAETDDSVPPPPEYLEVVSQQHPVFNVDDSDSFSQSMLADSDDGDDDTMQVETYPDSLAWGEM